MYVSDHGRLVSRFHFSFAEYFNPKNMQFGVLRVLNGDQVQPGTGFETHPHENIEIVSYCVDGELTHGDSMGHKETLQRGDVQYLSAGTGITHSEMNDSRDKLLRFLQIWILPDKRGVTPQYGSKRFFRSDRLNRLLHVVSGIGGNGAITEHQDINIFTSEIDEGKEVDFRQETGRQSYLVCIEGNLDADGTLLTERDAAEITCEGRIIFKAIQKAHLIIIEMAR